MVSKDDVSIHRISKNLIVVLGYLTATSLLVSGILKVYWERDVERILSFYAFDPPVMPLGTSVRSFGQHFFGDYALLNIISRAENVAIPGFFPTPWFPATYLLFSPLTLVPYTIGLIIFLIGLVSASIWPISVSTRSSGFSKSDRFIAILFVGILSSPSLMTFDRGNPAGFLALILFVLITSIQDNNDRRAGVAFILGCLLKPHFVLFSLLFVAEKKLIFAFKCVSMVAIIHIVGFLTSGGNPIDGVRSVITNVTRISESTPAFEMQSISNVLSGLAGAFPTRSAFLDQFFFETRNLLSIIFLCWVGVLIHLSKRLEAPVRLTLICGLYPTIIPSSPTYNSVLFVGLFAAFLYQRSSKSERLSVWNGEHVSRTSGAMIALVFITQLVPIPFAYRGQASLQKPIATTVFFIFILFASLCAIRNQPPTIASFKRLLQIALVTSMMILIVSFVPSESRVLYQQKVDFSDISEQKLTSDLCSVSWRENSSLIITLELRNVSLTSSGLLLSTGSGESGIRIEKAEMRVAGLVPSSTGQLMSVTGEIENEKSQQIIFIIMNRGDLTIQDTRIKNTEPNRSPAPICDRIVYDPSVFEVLSTDSSVYAHFQLVEEISVVKTVRVFGFTLVLSSTIGLMFFMLIGRILGYETTDKRSVLIGRKKTL